MEEYFCTKRLKPIPKHTLLQDCNHCMSKGLSGYASIEVCQAKNLTKVSRPPNTKNAFKIEKEEKK
jgi:hypothetical protein